MITFKQFLNEARMSNDLADEIENASEDLYEETNGFAVINVNQSARTASVPVRTQAPKQSTLAQMTDDPEVRKKLEKHKTVDKKIKPLIKALNSFWEKYRDKIEFVSYVDLGGVETTEKVFTMPVAGIDFMKPLSGKFVFHFKDEEELDEAVENDDDEDEWLTPLKSFKDHHHNGRVWVNAKDADGALDAVHDPIDKLQPGDLSIWHDWMNDTVYEIYFTADDKAAITRILDRVKKKFPSAQTHYAYVRSSNTVRHEDWKDYP